MVFHLFQMRMNVWKMMEAVNSAVSTLPDLTPAHATQATSGTWMDDRAMVGQLDFSNFSFSNMLMNVGIHDLSINELWVRCSNENQ